MERSKLGRRNDNVVGAAHFTTGLKMKNPTAPAVRREAEEEWR